MIIKKQAIILFCYYLFMNIPLVHADGLILDRTRIILSPEKNKMAIQLYNSNDYPIIAQLWVDKDMPLIDPEKNAMPIIVNPPLIKLEAGEKRFINLLPISKKAFSQAQESLY